MQALILAGGKGTRLRPLTVYTPKPIVPLVNRPFLLYQIEVLRHTGITDITLSLSYQPDKIQQILGNGSEHGVSIRYISEPSPLGTAGAYKFALDGTKEPAIVFNGDILTNIDIERLIAFHNEKGSAATIAITAVDDPARYGLVQIDKSASIKSFVEKPKPGDAKGKLPNTINAGIYVLDAAVLDVIEDGANASFEYGIFPAVLEKKMPFFGYTMEGEYWCDIGTPTNYLNAHHDLLGGAVEGFELEKTSAEDVATRSEIDAASVIGPEGVIKPGVRIVNSVIGPGVHIEEKAVIENSVIWAHTRISTAAEIRNSVIGRSCHIGRNAVVSHGSVLGDKTTLTDYTRV